MTDHLLNLLSIAIAFVVIEAVWIILLLKFSGAGGYKCGREEGFEAGFEAGRAHADQWWCEAEREIEQEREKIRGKGRS